MYVQDLGIKTFGNNNLLNKCGPDFVLFAARHCIEDLPMIPFSETIENLFNL